MLIMLSQWDYCNFIICILPKQFSERREKHQNWECPSLHRQTYHQRLVSVHCKYNFFNILKMLYCHLDCWEPLFIKEKLIILSEVNFLCKLNFVRNLCFITKKRKLRMLNLRSLVSNCWQNNVRPLTVYPQFPKNIPQPASSFKLYGTHEVLQH